METIGANQYKLILLDTNAIREIVQQSYSSHIGFERKFLTKNYCPCISWYSLVELKPASDIYNRVISFVRQVPTLLIMPYKTILQKEYHAYLSATTVSLIPEVAFPLKPDFLKQVFSNDSPLKQQVEKELKEESPITTEFWKNQRGDSMFSFKNFNKFENANIKKFLLSGDICQPNDNIDIEVLPAARLMSFLQLTKVHSQRKNLAVNDVMDIMISAIIPYIDAVITEKNQANLYLQAKSFIEKMNSLEIYILDDIRQKNK